MIKREWALLILLILVGNIVLSACSGETVEVTRVVKETVVERETVVEKETVIETVIETVVEKEEVVVTVEVVKEVKEVVVATPEVPEGLWYDPKALGESYANICPNTPPKYGGTLISILAAQAMQERTWITGSQDDDYIFSQLMDRNMDLTISPDLAENWEVSEDGLVYTFYLRDDVKFHDGHSLTAEDVKYSIEMCSHPATSCYAKGYAPYEDIEGFADFVEGEADAIAGVEVLDEYTVRITLSAPRYFMIPMIGTLNIWPKHVMEEIPFDQINDSEYAKKPIGSGPFKMGDFEPDQFYILEANQDYHLGRPYLDRIIFRIGMEDSPAWIGALESGEIHVGTSILGPDRERLKENPNVALVGGAIPGAMSIWANTETLNKRVRQALYYALDREAIVKGIYFGDQAVAWGWDIADPLHVWSAPDTPVFGYDPDKARELLAEAEADGAWDPNYQVRLVSYYERDTDKAAMAAMQQYWADVGINVNIETMDTATYADRVYTEKFDFDLALGCCGISDPTHIDLYYTCDKIPPNGYNAPQYCVEEVDTLMANSLVETDPDQRQQIWYDMINIVAEDVFEIALWSEVRVHAIDENVCGYQFRQYGELFPDQHPEQWYLAGE